MFQVTQGNVAVLPSEYDLETHIPMNVAERLFNFLEQSGSDIDQFVTTAIETNLEGGAL